MAGELHLHITDPRNVQKVVGLDPGTYTMGSDDQNQIHLQDSTISWRHATARNRSCSGSVRTNPIAPIKPGLEGGWEKRSPTLSSLRFFRTLRKSEAICSTTTPRSNGSISISTGC